MKRRKFIFVLFCICVLTGSLFPESNDDSNSEIKFAIDTRFGLCNGVFKKTKLFINDKAKKTGILEIETNSIDTNNSKRDKHLRNDDFFDVVKFPKATFEILQLQATGKDTLQGKGKLTIKGIAKEYEFQVNYSTVGELEKYSGKMKINRRDFGITYDSVMNPIQDIAEVEFTISISLKPGIKK